MDGPLQAAGFSVGSVASSPIGTSQALRHPKNWPSQWLSPGWQLSTALLGRFAEDGYITVPQLLTPEALAYLR